MTHYSKLFVLLLAGSLSAQLPFPKYPTIPRPTC